MEDRSDVVLVLQEKLTYCFPACLQSYLLSLGIRASQREIIDRNPEEFRAGTPIEGAMAPDRMGPVMERWGLWHQILKENEPLEFIHPIEAVFFTLYWKARRSDRHWVRYIGRNEATGGWLVMEPSGGSAFPAETTTDELARGIYVAVKIGQKPLAVGDLTAS